MSDFPSLAPLEGNRFRTAKLEDGEPVIQLRGWKTGRYWPSDGPHAGIWGKGAAYALVRKAAGRSGTLQAFDSSLSITVSDADILVRGDFASIVRLLLQGPACCRARRKRQGSAEAAERLAGYRFTKERP